MICYLRTVVGGEGLDQNRGRWGGEDPDFMQGLGKCMYEMEAAELGREKL